MNMDENGWEMDEHGPFIDDKHDDSPNLKMKKQIPTLNNQRVGRIC